MKEGRKCACLWPGTYPFCTSAVLYQRPTQWNASSSLSLSFFANIHARMTKVLSIPCSRIATESIANPGLDKPSISVTWLRRSWKPAHNNLVSFFHVTLNVFPHSDAVEVGSDKKWTNDSAFKPLPQSRLEAMSLRDLCSYWYPTRIDFIPFSSRPSIALFSEGPTKFSTFSTWLVVMLLEIHSILPFFT